ncbi:hypothetical protein F5Y18DRAFT_367416 [Xylariaceae sp. FL1019]|nr:hypothetical protein F5Y18DRAFT_367416 [Xylariaceae sp. FL1019]
MFQTRPKRQFKQRPPPPGSSDASDTEIDDGGRRFVERRNANVYDAVAGRVTTTRPIDGFNPERPSARHHKRSSRGKGHDPTLAPEEVLFRRSDAPIRFAEKDIYNAHEDLPDGGRRVLPDSDMLKAVHSYAAHFYGALNGEAVGASPSIDERSMDETALLAFGILLEEASREALGRKGDLVFTEGEDMIEQGGQHDRGEASETFGFKDAQRYEERQRLKRQRLS